MSVIDIRNKILFSHFDFSISLLRIYKSLNYLFDGRDSVAINFLKKYVYENGDSEN